MTRKEQIEQAAIAAYGTTDCRAAEHFVAGAMWADANPGLKESEDERIRKKLICFVENWKNFSPNSPFDDYAVYTSDSGECDKILAWLEKQGEQNPTDKVEPKFKVGDWVVNTVGDTNQVVKVWDDGYTLDNNVFLSNSWATEHYRLWTINDAKDGDVLVTTSVRNCPFIYRKTDHNNNLAYFYAGIDGNGNFREGCIKRTLYHFGSASNVAPATKEQRDLLFQKMKEAGYEWNSEKKELKKIEHKMLDADEVIDWLKTKVYDDSTYGMAMIDQFKKDFGL